jgi:type VI secretion system secreted protein Hcp
MATSDFLLEFKGPTLKGESQDDQYKDSIHVESWNWGAQNSSSHAFGKGGGTGKATHGDLQFTKVIDTATTTLMDKINDGTHFDQAILHCRKTAGETRVEYLKITMKKVTVTSHSLGGQSHNNMVSEHFSLGYEEIKIEYTAQNPDGTKGATVQHGWNLAQNKKAA